MTELKQKKRITRYISKRKTLPRTPSEITFFNITEEERIAKVDPKHFANGSFNLARMAKETTDQANPTMIVLESKEKDKGAWVDTTCSARFFDAMRRLGLTPPYIEPAIFGGDADAEELTKIDDLLDVDIPAIWRLVIPYCPGKKFTHILYKDDTSDEKTLCVFYQVADSLNRLWEEEKLIHGDLNDFNILVQTDTSYHPDSVFDFGVHSWLIDGGCSKKEEEQVTNFLREKPKKKKSFITDYAFPNYHAPEVIPILDKDIWTPTEYTTRDVKLWIKSIIDFFCPDVTEPNPKIEDISTRRSKLTDQSHLPYTVSMVLLAIYDTLINGTMWPRFTEPAKPEWESIIPWLDSNSLAGSLIDPRVKIPTASSNQDIFSWGHMILEYIAPSTLKEIDNHIQMDKSYSGEKFNALKSEVFRRDRLMFKLDETLKLLLKTQRKNPDERPKWKEIINQLRKELLIARHIKENSDIVHTTTYRGFSISYDTFKIKFQKQKRKLIKDDHIIITRIKNLSPEVLEAMARDPNIGNAIFQLSKYIPTSEHASLFGHAIFERKGHSKKIAVDKIFENINNWFATNPAITFEEFQVKVLTTSPTLLQSLNERSIFRKTRLSKIATHVFATPQLKL